MAIFGNLFNRNPATPTAKTTQGKTTAGVFYTIPRLLGSTSVLSLVSGTSSNITLVNGNQLSATNIIPTGTTQTAVVRESTGYQAIEYPLSVIGTGSGAIVAPARYVAYSDDFETAGLLTARPNWSDLGTGLLNKWSTTDGFTHLNAAFTAANTVVLGAQMSDFIAVIGYDTSGVYPTGYTDTTVWSAALQSYRFWHQDENNYMYVALDPATGNGRITVSGKIAGTNVAQFYSNNVPFAASKKGELVIQNKAGQLRFRLDGKWLQRGPSNNYPYDVTDVTGVVPTANRVGYTGINAQARRWAQAQYFSVTPLDVSIDFINDAVGHDVPGGVVGTADVRGVYTGTPTRWIYRVLNYNTQAVVQDWKDMTSNTANSAAGLPTTAGTNAAYAGTVSLPDGGPYTVEAGYIGSDNLRHTNFSTATLCGTRVCYYGQSNSTGRGSQSYTPSSAVDQAAARTDMISSIPDGSYSSTTRPYAYPAAYELAKQTSTILGKPVIVDVRGLPGVSLSALVPGSDGWVTFLAGLNSTRGVIEAIIWDQGEGNADGAFPPTAYSSDFRTQLLTGIRSVTGNPNIKIFINPVGRYANTVPPSSPNYPAAQIDSQREVLRQQYLDIMANDSAVSFIASKLGIAHSDSYHYAAAGYVEMGRREGWTLAKSLGANCHDGIGPKLSTATRSGAVITMPINFNGATSVTGPTNVATGTVPTPTLGNALYGFQVSKDGFTTTLPISTIAISGNNLVITLASDPGSAVSIRSHYGWSYDDTNCFYGTYTDTTPIPFFPVISPIVASTSSSATFTAPYNREFVALGDSRMQYSASDTYNSRFIQTAAGRGLQHWLPLATGGALLPAAHAEYGVAGDTPTNILARTGVKSLAALAANRAANAIFMNGSAESPNSATGVGSNCRRDFATIVANLTTNAGGLSFFNNTPKNLIIMNEWPRGAPNPGKTDSIPTTTAQRQALKDYADWVKRFSYDSGDVLANPRVVVVDTFNDPRILDTSTFPDYKNRVGLMEDGVHQTGPMGKVAAQVVADRIGSLFPYNNATVPLPTSSNLSVFLNPNPLMTGTSGTAATYTYYKGTLVGTLPSNVVLASANNSDMTGLTATVTYEGSGDSLAMVVRFTGTVANSWGLTIGQTASSAAATTGINIASDRLIAGMEYAQSMAAGTLSPTSIKSMLTARCSATPTSAVTSITECIFGDMVQNGYDTGHDYQRVFAPIIDFNDGNKCTTGVTGLENTLEIYAPAGTVDFTVKMRRVGVSKLS